MLFRVFRRHVRTLVLLAVLSASAVAEGHVVPNMTIEADFTADSTYTLRINVDPRTFLAADPTTLPPVPGSWYREQTPEQVAATHETARQYLSHAISVLFNGQKATLSACEIQAMDGADNTPLNANTQEVHLLATVSGHLPANTTFFQIDFAKDANTTLILLHSQAGKTELRPQVIFPGETSRAFQLTAAVSAPPPVLPVPPASSVPYLVFTLIVACILGIVGWRALNRHRHYHRAHRKPGPM